MKRKGGNDDKQRTISHFFKTSAANVSKPAAQPHKAAAPVQPHAEQTAALETPPKRQKLSQESDVVIIDELDHSNDQETAATSAADVTDAVRATTTAAQLAAIPANRSAARHNKAQRKLVGSISATSLAEPGPASTQAARAGTTVSSTVAGGASRRQQQQPTYTPLEKQVVKLKEANPGVSCQEQLWQMYNRLLSHRVPLAHQIVEAEQSNGCRGWQHHPSNPELC
eukprot:GHUV01018792.1.p1 GENE.GHUV01018792.1~~GHUV01018792.1.p1  ORF type:complete len:226 (+),score=59.55 GHUV01018792.1:250-927(+)